MLVKMGVLESQLSGKFLAVSPLIVEKHIINRTFSNSHGWTGSRLMRANLFMHKLIFPH